MDQMDVGYGPERAALTAKVLSRSHTNSTPRTASPMSYGWDQSRKGIGCGIAAAIWLALIRDTCTSVALPVDVALPDPASVCLLLDFVLEALFKARQVAP